MSSVKGSGASGQVYFVGAGPGDPGLITVRGAECLQMADVVLYDSLANPELLKHAPSSAECICLGRHGKSRLWTMAEIVDRLVQEACAGKVIVRLKGGDPAVFARCAEEVEAVCRQGIAYEIVPGITSALAAASYLEVPITHRELSSALSLVVGQEKVGKLSPALDYGALGTFPGTLIFYMGVTSAARWTAELMRGGKSPETPVLIVRRATYADQKTLRCRLTDVAGVIDRQRLRPPAVIIVGPAVEHVPATSWFTARPLFGRTVLITRPAHQAGSLGAMFQSHGAAVRLQPAIEIQPPDDWRAVDQAIASMPSYDWVVFSSANGVQSLLDRVISVGRDLRILGGVQLAGIGPGTTARLHDYHLHVDRQPDRFQAEDLAASLVAEAPGKRFLLIRASRGREVLAEQLRQAGGEVAQVVVYNSIDVQQHDADIGADLAAGRIDWITVTSSAIARSLHRLFGDALNNARLVSISPLTTATLAELGCPPSAEAEAATMPSLVDAVVAQERREAGV